MIASRDDIDLQAETPTQAAVRFARAGISVFPVAMPGKEPPPGYLWKQRASSMPAEVEEN